MFLVVPVIFKFVSSRSTGMKGLRPLFCDSPKHRPNVQRETGNSAPFVADEYGNVRV